MKTPCSESSSQLDPHQVGERVRVARRNAHLSQAELANRAGLSRVSINQLENGRRSHVNPEVLRRIAGVLNRREMDFCGVPAESADHARSPVETMTVSGPLLAIFERLVELPDHQQAKVAQILEDMFDWREMALTMHQ